MAVTSNRAPLQLLAALIITASLGLVSGPLKAAPPPRIELPRAGITGAELAVVVNRDDPYSVVVSRYYIERRHIPPANVITVGMEPHRQKISAAAFEKIMDEVRARTPGGIQAYLLTWVTPYRVDCMSITSAFAFGFNRAFCAKGCKTTRPSPYFNSPGSRPYDDYHMRPTMMLAASSVAEAKRLIDRSVRADGRIPYGQAWLVSTDDRARNSRAAWFGDVSRFFGDQLDVHVVHRDAIRHEPNVMFYFIGAKRVADIDTNQYLPGAVADHLTSTGGRLVGGHQMSVLRWIDAGVTASYGTVVEPCNYPGKFPYPAVLLNYYLRGSTVIEAYWKSVAMPGQGVFVGAPLARPWDGYRLRRIGGELYVSSPVLTIGRYRLLAADHAGGPWRIVDADVPVVPMQPGIVLPEPLARYYRIERLSS